MPKLQVLLQGLFEKRRLLDYIRHFILWETGDGDASPRSPTQVTFLKDLLPVQLDAVEQARSGGGLRMELRVRCTIHDPAEPYPSGTSKTVYKEIPASVWIDALRQMGYLDVRVLEIPLQPGIDGEPLLRAETRLQEARQALLQGDYDGVAVACRKAVDEVIDELGKAGFRHDPKSIDFSKPGRYVAMAVALRRLADPSAHADASQLEAGAEPTRYSRPDALFLIETTTSLLARAARSPWKQEDLA